MRLVSYAPGVWDLLHPGHVSFLKRAKELVPDNCLVVGVPTDSVVQEDKGELPILSLAERVTMLRSVRYVDLVVTYERLDFLRELISLRPDYFVIGEGFGGARRHALALDYCNRVGIQVVRLTYTPSISSSIIKQRIVESCC